MKRWWLFVVLGLVSCGPPFDSEECMRECVAQTGDAETCEKRCCEDCDEAE